MSFYRRECIYIQMHCSLWRLTFIFTIENKMHSIKIEDNLKWFRWSNRWESNDVFNWLKTFKIKKYQFNCICWAHQLWFIFSSFKIHLNYLKTTALFYCFWSTSSFILGITSKQLCNENLHHALFWLPYNNQSNVSPCCAGVA